MSSDTVVTCEGSNGAVEKGTLWRAAKAKDLTDFSVQLLGRFLFGKSLHNPQTI